MRKDLYYACPDFIPNSEVGKAVENLLAGSKLELRFTADGGAKTSSTRLLPSTESIWASFDPLGVRRYIPKPGSISRALGRS